MLIGYILKFLYEVWGGYVLRFHFSNLCLNNLIHRNGLTFFGSLNISEGYPC